MLSKICWIVSILALSNAIRLKHIEIKQKKKERVAIEKAIIMGSLEHCRKINADTLHKPRRVG